MTTRRKTSTPKKATSNGGRACTKCGQSLEDLSPQRRICDNCRRAYQAEWARNRRRTRPNPARPRSSHASTDQYEQLFSKQHGVCLICKEPETAKDYRTGRPKNLAADTDHNTGELRGLLCGRCNMSLGLMIDDPDRMFAAMQYLGDPKERSNGGNWQTLNHILSMIEHAQERMDATHTRIDATLAGQQGLSKQMTGLHTSMHDLRETTNDRLHGMEADILVIRRPLTLLAQGWTKVAAFSGASMAITGIVVRFELWHLIPGL